MRLGSKGPLFDPPYRRHLLERCSKVALWDAFLQSVAVIEGRCDDTPTEDEVRRHLEPILRMRGDRIP